MYFPFSIPKSGRKRSAHGRRRLIRGFPIKKMAAAIYAAAAFLVQMILLLGVHGALPAILAQTLKLDGAVNLGEQGVVAYRCPR